MHRGLTRFGSELYETIYKEYIYIYIYRIIQFGPKAGLAPVGVCMIRGSSGRDTSFVIKVPTTSKIRRQCTEFRFMWSPNQRQVVVCSSHTPLPFGSPSVRLKKTR